PSAASRERYRLRRAGERKLEDTRMRRKAIWSMVVGAFLLAGPATVPSAQQQQPSGQLKPEGVPFNFNGMEMQTAPAAGVAVRAGRMFDAKAGTMLTNQIIF